jgi:hypothetical protein
MLFRILERVAAASDVWLGAGREDARWRFITKNGKCDTGLVRTSIHISKDKESYVAARLEAKELSNFL